MVQTKNIKVQYLGIFLGLLGSILFSTKAVFVKLAYNYEVDAVTMLLLRMLFALPFYLGIAIYHSRKKTAYQFTKTDYWQVLFLGIIGYYLASLLDFVGLKYITASLERLILFAYPTIVVLIGFFYYKEKINRSQIYALLLTYFGIAVVFIGNVSITNQHDLMIGSFLIILCAVAYAIYISGSGQLVPKIGTWLFTSYVLSISAIAVIIHYLIQNKGLGEIYDLPIELYGFGLLMAVVSTVIPTLIIAESIRLIGASNLAIISSVGPISTIILAWIFLEERLTLIQILGGMLVLFGVAFISFSRKRK